MKTTEYLDAVKTRLEISSDYGLAKVLGIARESVNAFRNGRSAMGIETCMKVGEILDVDGHAIYAQGQIERAKKPEIRDFWQKVSEKFSGSFINLLSQWDGRERRSVSRAYMQ
jgi:DNA-binding XRE family transcriptional regulator